MEFNHMVKAGLLAALALLLGLLAGCSLFREPTPTPRPTTVAQVTADQVAQAMDGDAFYATYGHTTLLIQGTVASIDPRPGHFTLTFASSTSTAVECDLGSQTPPIKVGDPITVRSADPEKDVSRQNGAVLIHNCAIP